MFNRSNHQMHPDKQELVDVLWDLFKDVYGSRPRGMDYASWHMSDLAAEAVRLQRLLNEQLDAKRQQEIQMYNSILSVGCPSIEDADRWIEDAYFA